MVLESRYSAINIRKSGCIVGVRDDQRKEGSSQGDGSVSRLKTEEKDLGLGR